jgi:hypothetical protein
VNIQLIKNQKGMAALIVVVIIGAATLLIATTASYLGLAQLEAGFSSSKAIETSSVADGCMDETLNRIRRNTSHGLITSPISLSLGNGSCIINVVDLGSGQRRVTVAAIVGYYNKKIEEVVTLTGNVITVNSWQELSN